jgi:serine/threonine protein phosphatase PrpC
MKYNYKSLTHVGKVRKANEDSCGEYKTPHGTLLIVCDGMGGHVGGAVASSTAVEKIYEYINNRDSSLGYQTLLHDAIVFANHQVFGMSTEQPELKGMGTTCVVVLISDSGLVYHAHVGDSRLYLLRDKGISRVTKDHSLVQLLHDQGQITEDEMETHPNKNQILKAIGTDFDLRPEVCKEPMQMKENDILLICSDGLCGMVHDRDIARITYANISNLENATQLLVDEANNNGGKDNITATLVSFGEPVDQKVVMTAAPVQNTESPKNNKRWLLYGGMGLVLLLLVGFLVWGRGGKTELSYCECYKNLSDRIKGEKSDSLKIVTFEKDSEECKKKKKESCKEQNELEKTIEAVKEAEVLRLEKDNVGKVEGKDGKDNKDSKEDNKEDEKKKDVSKAKTDNNKSADCQKIPLQHIVKSGDNYVEITKSLQSKCSKEDLKCLNKPADVNLIQPNDTLNFECTKCK